MLLTNGAIRLASLHQSRLLAGMQLLGFSFPAHLDFSKLISAALQTAAKNNLLQHARIRLQLFSDADGLFEPLTPVSYLIECYPITSSITEWNENGQVVGLFTDARKARDAYSHCKTSNSLVYALAAKRARTMKWNDALVCNTEGSIIESAIANVFCIIGATIFTPPLSEGCVEGVMRRHLLSRLPAFGLSVVERPFSMSLLEDADELFLTNAIKGVKWVSRFGENHYVATITRQIADLITA